MSIPALRWYKAQAEWKYITDNLREDKHTAIMLREKTIPHTDAVLLDNGRYLYLLYERQEDTVRMEETARNIMEKPVKIMNRKARDIRLQVRKKMYW